MMFDYNLLLTEQELSSDPVCLSLAKDVVPFLSEAAVDKTMVAAFPGSGSKWLLGMVQRATGLGTQDGYELSSCLY